MNYLHTLVWAPFDGTPRGEAHLMWETQNEVGEWVSLLSVPEIGYVLTVPSGLDDMTKSFREQSTLSYDDLGGWVDLSRPEAGRLAVALVSDVLESQHRTIGTLIDRLAESR